MRTSCAPHTHPHPPAHVLALFGTPLHCRHPSEKALPPPHPTPPHPGFLAQAAPEVRNSLNLDLDSQSVSVHAELERLGCVDLLSDAECAAAVLPLGPSELAERKSTAVASLLQRYGGEDEALRWRLEWVILSLGDDEALTQAHVTPVRRMIQMLREHFDVTYTDKAFSLAIQAGRNGARLTHSHATQFAYVEQSLHLWQAILSQLARLWSLAEGDLLRGGEYRLRDTGQGLNRVQAAPTVGRFMHSVLGQLQGQVGGWVGSAAVHLGDNDVPNALHWIDKYTQIPRILTPVLDTLSTLDTLLTDTPAMDDYVKDAFGSADNCRKSILADFFKHAFDGSGADNYFDAGSCIDGRLTSAWNWCSKLSKKPYYPLFKMAGFAGFDGNFGR